MLKLKRSLILAVITVFLLMGCMSAHAWLQLKNGAISSLASGITSSATSVTLTSGAGTKFPQSGSFRAVIWTSAYSSSANDSTAEYVTATWTSGDTFTIVRAAESSAAKAWSAGSYFANVVTAGKFTEIHSAVDAKAGLASPAFTGTPTAPTAAVGTNSTQLATTQFVHAAAASTAPLINGTAAVGDSFYWARANHVHPTDTSRAAVASPTFTGTVTAPRVVVTGQVTTGGLKRVTTRFDKTSSTTLENIPGLSVPVEAGKTYAVSIVAYVTNGEGGGQFALGGTCTVSAMQMLSTRVSVGNTVSQEAYAAELGYPSPTNLGMTFGGLSTLFVNSSVTSHLTVTVATTGTLTLQFRQYQSNATASSIAVGSTFSVQEIQ
jgi:hypothetical protein